MTIPHAVVGYVLDKAEAVVGYVLDKAEAVVGYVLDKAEGVREERVDGFGEGVVLIDDTEELVGRIGSVEETYRYG